MIPADSDPNPHPGEHERLRLEDGFSAPRSEAAVPPADLPVAPSLEQALATKSDF